MQKTLSLFALISFVALRASYAGNIDLGKIEESLKGDGLIGRVHGSAPDYGLFVFTYRDPGDFFSHLELPMARYGAGVLEQIQKLSRHDQVRIKGNFIQNSAPLIHLNIDSVELLSHWKDDFDLPPYQRSLTLPKEILAGTELVGKVHAISGTVVVVDYKDLVLPVYFKSASELLGLHRGDLIHLSYKAYQMGSGPIHLVSTNIHVLDSILAKHGKPLTVEGQLILYPKSPQISIDVYAVQEVGLTGVALDYTLVNFESPEIFQKIRDKLKVAWDNQAQAVVRARNKLSNPRVRIKAVGIGNVVDPNQANPQILLDGPDSIEILP